MLEFTQRTATTLVKGLEKGVMREHQRQLELFSLESRRIERASSSLHLPKRGCRRCYLFSSARTQVTGREELALKLNQGRFSLDF